MRLIKVYNCDYESIGLYDLTETNCPDDHLKKAFEEAYLTDDPEEHLSITWGIERVFIDDEIQLDI